MENKNGNFELLLKGLSEQIAEQTTRLVELQSELTSQLTLGAYSEKSLEIERVRGKILGLKDARFLAEMIKDI